MNRRDGGMTMRCERVRRRAGEKNCREIRARVGQYQRGEHRKWG